MKKSKSQYTPFEKMVLPILAFAFFWLVIGDLIIIHERAIFGFDPFTSHTPFAKPDKSKSFKLYKDDGQKTNKSKGFSNNTPVWPIYSDNNIIFESKFFSFSSTFFILKDQSDSPIVALRGPPVC